MQPITEGLPQTRPKILSGGESSLRPKYRNRQDHNTGVTERSRAKGDRSVLTRLVWFLQVSVLRGSDGFGFTIFSDHPVRVQAVDPGEIPTKFTSHYELV